eukprot:2185393-Pyramimonas_sp.AAC.1
MPVGLLCAVAGVPHLLRQRHLPLRHALPFHPPPERGERGRWHARRPSAANHAAAHVAAAPVVPCLTHLPAVRDKDHV